MMTCFLNVYIEIISVYVEPECQYVIPISSYERKAALRLGQSCEIVN